MPRLRSFIVLSAVHVAVGLSAAQIAAQTAGESEAISSPARLLTRVADVKTWADRAGDALPVEIEGVITWASQNGNFFLHDGDMGIHVRGSEPGKAVRAGERVLVSGVTRRGTFAPSIEPRGIVSRGPGQLPVPRRAAFKDVASGTLDGQWLELEGVVSGARFNAPSPTLSLALDGRRLHVIVNDTEGANPESLIDAEVRLRGVASGSFNRQRQLVEPVLRVAGLSSVTVLRPPPPDPFAVPLVPMTRLLGFSLEAPTPHSVRIQAVVTRQVSDRVVYVRGEHLGLKVELRAATALQPGTRIEAVGFPVMSGGAAVLESALCRALLHGDAPSPVRPSPLSLRDGSHSADLVTVRAQLVDRVVEGTTMTLILLAENQLFRATLQPAGTSATLPERNSIVDATGICLVSELDDRWYYSPRAVTLLLSSPADLAVVQRPGWWNPQRLGRALTLLLVLLVAGLGWVWSLRRQVLRKRAVIEEQARRAAALEERSRIARDLHDTLEQSLTGLSLQLKAVETDLYAAPPKANASLDAARQMLRQTRAVAQDAIAELRSDTVARRHETLVEGLRRVVKLWIASGALQIDLSVTGSEKPLPHHLEQHLLSIAMEAMTNAVKHGFADVIRVQLAFRPDRVLLTVEDNGAGFNPSAQDEAGPAGFGLLGMRERAHQIRARIDIQSHPGGGTVIHVEVPLGPAARAANSPQHRTPSVS
jgi:signal transduction histidine kinase